MSQGVLGYTLRRLLGALPTLLVIVTAAFFLMRLAPGGPFDDEQTLASMASLAAAALYPGTCLAICSDSSA